jgi:hypothetical protein
MHGPLVPPVNLASAFLAGVLGAVVVSLITFLVRLAGFPFGFELLLGSWVTGETGYLSWLTGLLVHFAIGGLFGILYAAAFGWMRILGARAGLLVSILHQMIAGFALAAIPWLHPHVPAALPEPGIYMSGSGPLGVALFVVVHLIFGAAVGGAYRPITLVPRRERRFAAIDDRLSEGG